MTVKDQLGAVIEFQETPIRIVSLVPSQTEFLYALGLEDQIVGQTQFCIHPDDKFKKAFKIGGTKKLNIPRIQALKPDIIIANKEENEQSQIETLQRDFPVWTSDIKNMPQAIDMMQKLGKVFGKETEANSIIDEINQNFSVKSKPEKTHSALYLIWRKPWMAAGKDTFVDSMLGHAGFHNVIKEKDNRYPALFMEDIKNYKPEFVLLSSEPFPFNDIHVQELQNELPDSKIILVDGEMFSWYGSRLIKSPAYFRTLL